MYSSKIDSATIGQLSFDIKRGGIQKELEQSFAAFKKEDSNDDQLLGEAFKIESSDNSKYMIAFLMICITH